LTQLAAIRLREIRLPLKSPFRISSGTVTDRRILLLELEDVDGVSGWSECVAAERPNYSPETVDTCWLAITRWFAPTMIGRSFREPAQVHGILEAAARGHPMAKAAVEMGVWELTARLRGRLSPAFWGEPGSGWTWGSPLESRTLRMPWWSGLWRPGTRGTGRSS
jgi:o-succinylbenzoate synthase